MTAPTDSESKINPTEKKQTPNHQLSKRGKGGEWGKERVLRVKPKGSQGRESVCHKAAASVPPPKGKHKRGGKIPALTGLQFPLPHWDDRMSSGANPKCRKDAAPAKFAPCHPKLRESAPRRKTGKTVFKAIYTNS